MEFINRLDSIMMFKRLEPTHIRVIAKLQLEKLSKKLLEREIQLMVDESTLDYLAEFGFSKTFGARPLRRLIEKEIEGEAAHWIISNKLKNGDTLKIKKMNGENRLNLEVVQH